MLFLSLMTVSLFAAQPPSPPPPLPAPLRWETRTMKIPFAFPPEVKEVKGVALFVSRDDGKTWKLSSTVTAEKNSSFKLFGDKNPGTIEFVAPADGLYSFSTQVLMKDGTKSPADEAKLPVQLRVLIDTSKK